MGTDNMVQPEERQHESHSSEEINCDFFEKIETRITDLQKAHVGLQEQNKQLENNFESYIDDSALRIIDILDMIALSKLNLDSLNTTNPNSLLVINKIEKRLQTLLLCWHVQEIIFEDNKIGLGKARVLETRKMPQEVLAGTIVEVCRKGYQRKGRTIRAADVITALD